jgi:hypothetical protein
MLLLEVLQIINELRYKFVQFRFRIWDYFSVAQIKAMMCDKCVSTGAVGVICD